jgi:hypothetical protein
MHPRPSDARVAATAWLPLCPASMQGPPRTGLISKMGFVLPTNTPRFSSTALLHNSAACTLACSDRRASTARRAHAAAAAQYHAWPSPTSFTANGCSELLCSDSCCAAKSAAAATSLSSEATSVKPPSSPPVRRSEDASCACSTCAAGGRGSAPVCVAALRAARGGGSVASLVDVPLQERAIYHSCCL